MDQVAGLDVDFSGAGSDFLDLEAFVVNPNVVLEVGLVVVDVAADVVVRVPDVAFFVDAIFDVVAEA